MSQLDKYLNQAQEYLEAVMHDPPPISREQWEADKRKKAEAVQQRKFNEAEKRKAALKKDMDKSYKSSAIRPLSASMEKRIAKYFQAMGLDMGKDHIGNNDGIVDQAEYNSWAQDAAGDMAYSVTQYPNSEREEQFYEALKKSGVTDVQGRVADYINDGILKAVKFK